MVKNDVEKLKTIMKSITLLRLNKLSNIIHEKLRNVQAVVRDFKTKPAM